MIKNAIPFIRIAGKTTTRKSSVNTAPALNIKIAVDRKTVPDISVPIQVRTTATANLLANLFNKITRPKKINAVIVLSIIFGTKPPGKVENNPEIIPVENPSKNTLLTSGNNNIPINIIVNIKSGFIPPLMPGIIM